MRALLTTALTLAFLLMAAITYVAVTQDPMAGEPRTTVSVAPPDLAKLQPKIVPAPAPVAAAPAAPAANPAAPSPNQVTTVAADVARAAENAGAPVAPAKPAPATAPSPAPDDSVEGATVVIE
jgi:hypothetical protein